MCNSTGLWTTLCALCNSKGKSSQRGKDMERKAWEKNQEKLEFLCYTIQVGSFMADTRQNGLRYRIATQAVAPELAQLMVLFTPSHTSSCKTQ